MKNKRLILVSGVLLISMLVSTALVFGCAKAPAPTAPTPTPAKVYEWKYETTAGATDLQFAAEGSWCKQVEEWSGGRMKITLYPDGAIVQAASYLDALRDQTLQLADFDASNFKSIVPEGGLSLNFPMVIRNRNEMDYVWVNCGWDKLLREAFDPQGVYTAFGYDYGGIYLWATKPIKTLNDFKGLKVRAIGDNSTVLQALGAAPTYLPHSESYTALQLGTINGYTTAITIWEGMKHYEIAPYISTPAINFGLAGFAASKDALAGIPQDLNVLIKSQMPIRNSLLSWVLEEAESLIMSKLASYGGETVPFDKEVVDAAAKEGLKLLDVYRDKTPRCAQMVDALKAYLKTKGR